MPWAKIDDCLYDSPEADAAGLDGLGLWVKGESYCARHLTDGVLSLEAIARLAGGKATAGRLASRLVTAGLWVEIEGGFSSKNWIQRNKSRADFEAKREEERLKKERQKLARLGLLSPGENPGASPGESPGVSPGSSPGSRPVPSRPQVQSYSVGAGAPPPAPPQLSLVNDPPPPPSSKPGSAEVAEAITHYQARWREIFRPVDGKPPVLTKADRGQLVAMLKRHGGEWRELLEKYLADREPYLLQNGHALALMPRRVNGYRARPGSKAPTPQGELAGDVYARQFSRPRPDGDR